MYRFIFSLVVLVMILGNSVKASNSHEVTDSEVIESLRVYIIQRGYRCDDVDHVNTMLFKAGYSVWCNRGGQLAYHYEVTDQGGNWIVNVK